MIGGGKWGRRGREVGEKGAGSGGEGGGKWGRRGRELGMGYPPVHPLSMTFSMDVNTPARLYIRLIMMIDYIISMKVNAKYMYPDCI